MSEIEYLEQLQEICGLSDYMRGYLDGLKSGLQGKTEKPTVEHARDIFSSWMSEAELNKLFTDLKTIEVRALEDGEGSGGDSGADAIE